LTCLLGALSYAVLKTSAPTPPSANPLPDAISFAALVSLIALFLKFRGISLRFLLGFDRLSPLRAIAVGLGLLAAAFPLILAASSLSHLFLQDAVKEQALVTLFRTVAKESDFPAMGRILLSGVILAPLTEEFLFRGYFYGTLKRFAGTRASTIFTCAIFAAIHLNLSSLAGLFVLALCLTAAYEATGSWLVPVTMHAGFNLSQLAYLYWQASSNP
jgi:membrane protease YdiL (CAAX protease family)